jgi:hypothetical protein
MSLSSCTWSICSYRSPAFSFPSSSSLFVSNTTNNIHLIYPLIKTRPSNKQPNTLKQPSGTLHLNVETSTCELSPQQPPSANKEPLCHHPLVVLSREWCNLRINKPIFTPVGDKQGRRYMCRFQEGNQWFIFISDEELLFQEVSGECMFIVCLK